MYRSSIAVIYSLKKLNKRIIAVTTESNPHPPAFHSRYLTERVVLSDTPDKYKEQLIELCKKHERPVIFPVGVFTLNIISENKEDFSKVSDFAVASKEVLDVLNNKKLSKIAASNSGLVTPGEPTSFPLVVKPFCGEKFGLKASERYKIAKNKKELDDAIKLFSQYDPDPIVEEYVEGCGVGISIVIGNDGKERTAFCHKRISEYPASGGPSSSLRTFIDNDLIKKAVIMLKSVGFSGIAMLEFKEKDGRYCFLEVNPRVWGSFGATYKTGSDFVEAYLSAATGSEYKFAPKYKLMKVKFLPNIFASVISYLKKRSIKKAFVSLFDAINPFVPNAIFSAEDPLPAIFDIFRKRR